MKHIIKAHTKYSNKEVDIEVTIKNDELIDIRSLSGIATYDGIDTLELPFLYTTPSGKFEKIYGISAFVFHTQAPIRKGVRIASNMHFVNKLILPKGVIYVCNNAFSDTNIKNVVWPETCHIIPGKCFLNSYIENVSGIKNVKSIEYMAFAGCKHLKSMDWPQQAILIPSNCFINCERLENINGIENVEEICVRAFCNCKSLNSFEWPKSCYVIPGQCFRNCLALKTVNIYCSIDKIESDAFINTNVKHLDLSQSVFCLINDSSVTNSINTNFPFYQSL